MPAIASTSSCSRSPSRELRRDRRSPAAPTVVDPDDPPRDAVVPRPARSATSAPPSPATATRRPSRRCWPRARRRAAPTSTPKTLLLGEAWANSASTTTARRPTRSGCRARPSVPSSTPRPAPPTSRCTATSGPTSRLPAGRSAASISGLRPVHVSALDATAVDVIVGRTPSGLRLSRTARLHPPGSTSRASAGRDVALVSIFFFAPLYPSAFTKFALGA